VFRVLVAVGLTAWLVVRASPADVAASLAPAIPGWVLAAVGLVIVDRTLMAYRWLLLLRAIEPGRHVPLGAVVRVFFVSTFVGSFLPGSVGGDAARAYGLSKLGVPTADALASVVVDRLLGVVSLLLAAAVGLVVVRRLVEGWAIAAIAGLGLAVAVAALLLLFDSRVLSGGVRWLTAARMPRLERLANKGLTAIRQYGRHRRQLTTVLAVSMVVQGLRILQAWCLGLALALTVGPSWYVAFVPVVVLVMLLPISVAGLGTSQAAFQVLFGTVGVAAPDALALSILFLGLGLVGNLPGGLLVAFGGKTDRS
jgi:uncharacterized protein (TIRG00374 family)